jgi:hypothetical protein
MTDVELRTRFLFQPLARLIKGPRLTTHRVSAIGESAGVKVTTEPRGGKETYASAHDFGRNAETTSETVWKALSSNASGNSAPDAGAKENAPQTESAMRVAK